MLRGDEDITEGLLNAFRLEKGAQAFYIAAAERVQDQSAVRMFRKLADVEDKHMHAIYELYNGFLGDRGPLSYDEFKKQMKSEFTESGKTIENALADVSGHFFMDAREVLQMALKEEESAHELYVRMAERAEDPSTASLYRELSEDEVNHMNMIKQELDRSEG